MAQHTNVRNGLKAFFQSIEMQLKSTRTRMGLADMQCRSEYQAHAFYNALPYGPSSLGNLGDLSFLQFLVLPF